MKQTVRRIALVVFVISFIVATLAAQDVKPKRGRFAISAFGGALSGVAFLADFTGSPVGVQGGVVLPTYDSATDGPLYDHRSAFMFGFSLGYIYSLSTPVKGRSAWSIYGEFTYCPAAKYENVTETLHRAEWDQAQFKFVDWTANYPQAGRKASASGATFGVIWMPFRTAPLGLDIGFGWWSYSQEYVSGTMQALQGIADLTPIYSEEADTGLSYGGNGKLKRSHSALAFKIGLTYRLLKFVWLDAAFRSLTYIDSHDTDLIYVDSGETVRQGEGHGLANLFSLGITFGF